MQLNGLYTRSLIPTHLQGLSAPHQIRLVLPLIVLTIKEVEGSYSSGANVSFFFFFSSFFFLHSVPHLALNLAPGSTHFTRAKSYRTLHSPLSVFSPWKFADMSCSSIMMGSLGIHVIPFHGRPQVAETLKNNM